MKRLFPLVAAGLLATVIDAAAQNAVFVTRHAERADAGSGATTIATDPELSEVGRARAQSLAATLKDAGVTAIFVTEYKRTQQTAEPLAKMLGIQPTVISAKDTQGLIEKVKALSGRALVVGHSNTVPEVLGKLGVENPPKLADSDYGDLFMVSRGDTTTMFRLHYR